MANRKSTKKYYFSVEGETGQWYLKWLQDLINATEEAEYKVSIDCRIQKNPLKYAKSLVITKKVEVYRFFDYESDEEIHVKGFQDALANNLKIWTSSKKRPISSVAWASCSYRML